ncbi:NADH-quinone oxidoreductase subunit NuoN, partial [bacterium]|nr:NADH-quinone oxidoreductase subunit NuoN [bacterium]
MLNNFIYIFFVPEIALSILSLSCLMYGLFSSNNSFNKANNFAIFTLLFTSFLIYFDFSTNFASFENFFSNTSFTKFFKILTTLGAAASLIISKNYFIDTKINRFEIPTLLLFSTLGMMIMISSKNIMIMYLAIELQSLSLYVVASIKRNSIESAESGVKYFILGALSSGILLYGFSLVYGFTGQTSFDEISNSLAQLESLPIGLIFGLVFVLVGLAFKISAVPFHMWTPDVYEGAPTSITAFFAIVPKLAATALIFRFCLEPFKNFYFEWTQVIFFLSVASMFLGAIAAIAQKNIKRLLAYSSIGHVGYVLIALVAASDQGLKSASIYMFIYIVMNIAVFSIILSLKKSDSYVENISELSGLSKSNPVVSVSLAIIMLSMAGIPPFIGFFGKFYVFIAAIES